ncbi:PE family protein [Mycobacterium pseudokansasii]|uniref:PE family protein PE3 n=1 Tax=Mycobacterium pseudokansasii TaxID=2341080 RepID=A0A498QK46_9MYCO|nr:PE-PPE domain-containing protein [Mycobacterium pseudokansasii]VBA46147.1 PE family protein PE3 [Mycobacterium pseudokansasii]
MTYLTTEPQTMTAAAADVARIGSAIGEANVAAAGRITAWVAAAADEVSAATATLFGSYAREYQAVMSQVAAFHQRFTQALAAAASAYLDTEAANAAAALDTLTAPVQSLLGRPLADSARTVANALTAMTAPAPAASPTTALVMGGSGKPIPDAAFVSNVVGTYLTPNFPGVTFNPRALFTPEGLYPAFGAKDLTLDASVSQGLTMLDDAIRRALAAGNPVAVVGLSQSAVVASLEMSKLSPTGAPSSLPITFTLLGNPVNPNGGLLTRFPGLSLPSLGITAYGAPPDSAFPTSVYTIEYDGYADFPRYPINILSDVNALAGIVFLHDTYPELTSLPPAITLPTQGPTQTTYYMIRSQHLPILTPLRALPLVGNPLADLIEPDLKVLVNLGYGDPAYGYSTGPANVPTPFELFPPVSPITVLGHLVGGTQQGVAAFASDIGAVGAPSPPDLPLSGTASPFTPLDLLGQPPATMSIDRVITGLQAANTAATNAVSNAMSGIYSALLPTADIANAVLISLPSYDLNLFLDGITQAAHGDLAGLVNAIGRPIAANMGVLTFGAGFELTVIGNAVVLMLGGQIEPG